MCGIVGVYCPGQGAARRPAVEAALPEMHHRGPDDTQIWNDDDVVLGFARLAIIDIEGSPQPLPYDNGRYQIIFNGEIYNYVELREQLKRDFGASFATEGDTETIVAAYHYYGDDCVTKLRGMFAFAIWDTQTRRMFGARDYFGIKPLYVTEYGEQIIVGSEKKCLLELIGSDPQAGAVDPVNTEALQNYLTLQYVPEPASMQQGIRRIESGTTFSIEDGVLRTQRYFHPTFPISLVPSDADKRRLYDRIAEVMDDSVRMHMRADVTVGSFLSGGIDSTAIAALAKRYNPDLLTFTVGFERDGFSEIDVAAESAEAIGVEHITKLVTPQEFADAVPLIVWYLDDPVADPALVPLWFIAREARKHVKVVLSGEGADELFGGYNIYREPLSLKAFEKVPGSVKKLLAGASKKLPDGMRGKDLLRRGSIPIEQRYYGNARLFRDDELGFLKTHRPDQSIMDVTRDIYARARDLQLDPVTMMQYVDLFTWLRGDILVKADKMTMANSLELRVPFLDKEVWALASTIPVDQKVTKETTKYALRQALKQIVPPHIFNRRKLGFPVPIRHWLKDDLYDWAREIIASSGAGHLIDLAAVQRMLDEHRTGQLDYSRKIWTVLIFLIWHEIFIEGSLQPEVPEVHYPVRL
ncbi:asparagine synthase (glutamine-hydrolyzing) [Epidermidibacterium keratini]|uniref:asparagine synthase (glutamine-hydrolyzing) n=1 Tax=Epidermidibacterium keratini TaxID=1891644 RepID=A0A7L4YKY1_9ACTN|nr:asparagine synthase (glutamine-hydrolyzing) [Epidermidibacterium keratini]QHB99206.1 asparagine synthase (glutamine-hydrolyzing) [Epidermidibacterium keratini]